MMSRRAFLFMLTAACAVGVVTPVLAKSRRLDPIRLFDTDSDGTVDLDEVKKAASAVFDRLEKDTGSSSTAAPAATAPMRPIPARTRRTPTRTS